MADVELAAFGRCVVQQKHQKACRQKNLEVDVAAVTLLPDVGFSHPGTLSPSVIESRR
jgi:hypothetical protein